MHGWIVMIFAGQVKMFLLRTKSNRYFKVSIFCLLNWRFQGNE